MTAAILRAAGRRTFLGGNIGDSLLERLPEIGPDDWVVLEISSFQLWHGGPCRLHGAVVTGCSPNHLDWHGAYADYVAAKQRILAGQTSEDFAVLATDDAEVASWSPLVRGRLIVLGRVGISACPEADKNVYPTELQSASDDLPAMQVPGRHNRMNAALAAAAAGAAGCRPEDVRRGLEGFRGLPQRLEWFATVDGRRFYNDSTATTPESTIAALESLDVPVRLLAGGKDKGFDFRPLAGEIVRRARAQPSSGRSARNSFRRREPRPPGSLAQRSRRWRRRCGGAGGTPGRARPSYCRRAAPAPISFAISASAASDLSSW